MPASELFFLVHGSPAPQGSKKGFVNKKTGKVIVKEQQTERVTSWREAVKAAALPAMQLVGGDGIGDEPWAAMPGAIHVGVTFHLPRSKNQYRGGRNAHLLRDDAPAYPARMPDIDKLLRSTFDALTDVRVFADDGQIVMVEASKVYGDQPGAFVRVTDLDALRGQTHRAIEVVEVQGALL